jgi:DUF4097 and DUF4098 domain-containing protein YvlB
MGKMKAHSRSHTFETPAPVRLSVENPKGRIRIFAEATETTRIELIATDAAARARVDEAEVTQSGEEIVVRIPRMGPALFGFWSSIEVVIHVPSESSAVLSTGSGLVETNGRLDDVRATSGSGAVRLGACGEIHARTGSGEIIIDSARGSVDAETGSGRIVVGEVGEDVRILTGSGHAELTRANGSAKLKTASGSIDVSEAGNAVDAFAVSGNVRVRRADHGCVRAKAISGRISVGVANGTAALLDISTVSGHVHSDLDRGTPPVAGEKHVELTLRTMSGSVNVARV